jgi:hypothetical protein
MLPAHAKIGDVFEYGAGDKRAIEKVEKTHLKINPHRAVLEHLERKNEANEGNEGKSRRLHVIFGVGERHDEHTSDEEDPIGFRAGSEERCYGGIQEAKQVMDRERHGYHLTAIRKSALPWAGDIYAGPFRLFAKP